MRNESTITSDARPPETDLGSRLPIVEFTTKPANGSRGMNGMSDVISGSPLQRGERIGIERLPGAEERDDNRQAHGRFRGPPAHDQEKGGAPATQGAAVPMAKGRAETTR